MVKTLNVNPLDSRSIEQAQQSLKAFELEVKGQLISLVEMLTELGEEYTKANLTVMDFPYGTGELESSVESVYNRETNTGIITVGTDHAWFVEFGTGVVGKEGTNHPMHNLVGWEHDVNGYGYEGWYYFADGNWHWTAGMASRPFMYETWKRIADEIRSRNQ